MTDLDESIRCQRSACERARTLSERVLFHGNLCFTLEIKYEAEPSALLLDEAIVEGQQALQLSATDQFYRPNWSENLARALLWRHQENGNLSDIENAIVILSDAAQRYHAGSTSWATCQANLAQAYLLRFSASHLAADLQCAMEAFSAAHSALSPETAPGSLLEIAPRFGELLGHVGEWSAAAYIMSLAVRSIENLYQAQLSGSARGAWLKHAWGVHAFAAFAIAKAHRLEEAVLTLEAGRARQLSDALELDQAQLRRLVDEGREDLFEHYQRAAE